MFKNIDIKKFGEWKINMKILNHFLVIIFVLIATGCKDEHDMALESVTENARLNRKCELKHIVLEKPKFECNPLIFEIAVESAKAIGISAYRIDAATKVGIKQTELENPKLVRKAELLGTADKIESVAAVAAAGIGDPYGFEAILGTNRKATAESIEYKRQAYEIKAED